ncbi:hypothetical protein MMC30_005215 [Trapelia coarctata]|nr:hypothetical protein [Trapelia coarctata]
MEYTRLGKSGLKVSKVILGGMSYGLPSWQGWVLPEEEAIPLLKHAYDVGLNTWDTADGYSDGHSELIIGKALKQYKMDRRRVVIMTKIFYPVDDPSAPSADEEKIWVNRKGLSRKYILDAVDASVKRLGTYIDVLQIHRLDRDVPPEEIMHALNDVIESGKVRYIGASSMWAWEFQILQNISEKHSWHKFISMQGYYNLLYREEEREMIPYCNHTGVGIIPWSPLARGRLARPYNAERTDEGNTHREKHDPSTRLLTLKTAADREITNRVEILAKRKNVSMAMISTVWCLMKEGVNPIIGLGSLQRIDEAVEAVKQASAGLLTPDEVRYLEEPYKAKSVEGGL